MIPYGRQWVSDDDIQAVVKVLKSDYLTQGPVVGLFEQKVADLCNAEFGVAVNSGTSALHIACLALGLKQGDILWTSPNSFVASANCARYCGAEVDFVDIEPDTGNLCIDSLTEKLKTANRQSKLPKIVVPVHYAGQPCNMADLAKLADKYGFKVLEDASHAVGARYNNDPVGAGRYSDITVFSFHPVKIVTTGEGGVALTNNPDLADKLRLYANHGITKDQNLFKGEIGAPWYYEQQVLGFNYRLSDIHAALGLSQLNHLDGWVKKRRELAAKYNERFINTPIRVLEERPYSYSSYHLYVIQVDFCRWQVDKAEFVQRLRSQGVGTQVHYIPIYKQPYYRTSFSNEFTLPNAEIFYQKSLSIPIYPVLDKEDLEKVADIILETLQMLMERTNDG